MRDTRTDTKQSAEHTGGTEEAVGNRARTGAGGRGGGVLERPLWGRKWLVRGLSVSSLLERSGADENVGQGGSELRAVTFISVKARATWSWCAGDGDSARGHSLLGQRWPLQLAVHRKAFTMLTSWEQVSGPHPGTDKLLSGCSGAPQ